MSDHTPWPLIAKYLAGECSKEEKLAMEWWLEEVDNEILFRQIKTAWQKQSESGLQEEFDPEKGINKLNCLILELEESDSNSGKKNKKYIRISSLLTAASILLLIGFGYLLIRNNFSDFGARSKSFIQKSSGNDQILSLLLPDGSKVWLNKNSKLTFPDHFDTSERIVFLEGEAFFEVIPHVSRPFVVRSKKISTRVLGTSFNVRAYKSDATSSIAVSTGKVEVSKEIPKGDPIRITQLTPRQELVINTEKDETYIDIVSASNIGSWRKNLLVFQNNTYAEVAARLEASFDVKIHLEDMEFAKCRVMASFNENASLDEVLKLLSISNHFNYSVDGSEVHIRGGVCK